MTLSTQQVVLLGLAVVFGFYMAWNIGANDVANAMGTSVGSGALTLKQAVILAGILEVAGAVFAGGHVADTMRGKIVDLSLFNSQTNNGPVVLACGMLAALLAAGIWLQIASYFGWPVSTTHSIVGALVGFGIAFGGLSAVNWSFHGGVGSIVLSWVISPLLSAVIAYTIFRFLRRQILFSPHPIRAARRWAPLLTFAVLFTMMLVLLFKGLQNVGMDRQPVYVNLVIAAAIGLVGAAICRLLVVRLREETTTGQTRQANDYYLAMTLNKAVKQLARLRQGTTGATQQEVARILQEIERLPINRKADEELSATNREYQQVERMFGYLQILTAGFVAFAHGANDVANAIGPMSAVVQTVLKGVIAAKSEVPLWALLTGGVGIVIGLATWGWRVIETIGRRITELSPSRGFSAEFATAITVLAASKLGLPISTTHTLVGAVMGVGLARGISALNLNALRDIAISWLITIPAGAGLAVVFFFTLRAIFV
ncbi:MAG: inorganic phosphate transporter [Phycisphaeraceae bacterium]